MNAEPLNLIGEKLGKWWDDDRRNWCAYCGVMLKFERGYHGNDAGTHDHLVPKPLRLSGRHRRLTTIPACLCCNRKRGARQLGEFFYSARFKRVRAKGQPDKAWSLRDLWLAAALAAVEVAHQHSDEADTRRSREAAS